MGPYYIVNPAIRSDDDYYRDDDPIVSRVLKGSSVIAIGHRRSGKTSFLFKIKRRAENAGSLIIFEDLGDMIRLRNTSEINDIIKRIDVIPKAIILLDEAEVLDEWPINLINNLFKAIKKHNVVISCSPSFLIEMNKLFESDLIIQNYLNEFEHYYLGGLKSIEAENLISLKKRPGSCTFDEKTIKEILDLNERIPIILNAICRSRALNIPINISLQNFGQSIITGITKEMKEILVNLANNLPIKESSEKEIEIMMSIGLLKTTNTKIKLSSKVLSEFLKLCHETLNDKEEKWNRHARILHISDLHFGKHNNEPEKSAAIHFERLKTVILNDKINPDFIVISGDLTWTGNPVEFEIVAEFFNKIVDLMSSIKGISKNEVKKRFIIVPGNHEASWLLSIGVNKFSKNFSQITDSEKERIVYFSLAPYANFINRFYQGCYFWDMECPCMIIQFENPSICFFALSTCHYITEQQKFGIFGSHVLERAAKNLEKEEVSKSTFRIGVWHHNLRPDEGISIKDVEAAAQVFAKSNPGIDLALHGHVHQGNCDRYSPLNLLRPIPYSSVGSFGVRTEHRPGDKLHGYVPNEFSIIDLETSKLGRQFTTQYYQLDLSIADHKKWEWKKNKPKITTRI